MTTYNRAKPTELKTSLQNPMSIFYHHAELRELDNSKIAKNKDEGKSCGNCKYITNSSRCSLKGLKRIKVYNICQYHK